MRHSLVSILLFGFSGLAVVYLIRQGMIGVRADSLGNLLVGLVILTLWNEIHFFVIHCLMHLPYFMKRVHWVHHRSWIPGVFSVYSFHPVEALLLSTVPLTIAPWVDFAPSVFLLFPLVSILLNFSGHANYRFGQGGEAGWFHFASRHNAHHERSRGHYGFVLPVPDWRIKSKKGKG
ncbi:MAG: sterol desaturase family protein [Bacteroidia bacterium]|nr:sterol desaturase family protein [Bacteroidia bacterium]